MWSPDDGTENNVSRMVQSNPAIAARFETHPGGTRGTAGNFSANGFALDSGQTRADSRKLYRAGQPGAAPGWSLFLGASRHGHVRVATCQLPAGSVFVASEP